MKAIFYDRRNQREVSSDELMSINLCETLVHYDEGEEVQFNKDHTICELGYKSSNCDKVCNWDTATTLNDLVFLRLED